MKGPYDDILHLPHYVSAKRKPMSMLNRAAQFSPFAALTGYDAAIQETGRLTDRQIHMDTDAEAMLDEKLRLLWENRQEKPQITVTYFVPDERKCGGCYENRTARVKKVDIHHQIMLLEDDTVVNFGRVRDIQGEIFRQIEGLYFLG